MMEKLIIIELCEKYEKSEKLIKLLIKICKDNNVFNAKDKIEKFFCSVSKSVSEAIK